MDPCRYRRRAVACRVVKAEAPERNLPQAQACRPCVAQRRLLDQHTLHPGGRGQEIACRLLDRHLQLRQTVELVSGHLDLGNDIRVLLPARPRQWHHIPRPQRRRRAHPWRAEILDLKLLPEFRGRLRLVRALPQGPVESGETLLFIMPLSRLPFRFHSWVRPRLRS